jgi:hypothetical protein
MSLKPLILIFQDLVQPTSTPVIPDLNAVIIGPAYDIWDYLDDGAALLLSTAYGTEDGSAASYVPPTSSAEVITVNEGGYPQQSAGARVDTASVRVALRNPRVVLGSTLSTLTDAPVLGAGATTSSSDRTLVTITTPAIDFLVAGVQPGDRILLTSSAGQVCVRTVASVGEPNGDGLVASGNESKLRVSQELPASGSGTSEWTYNSTGEFRIERILTTRGLESSLPITFPEPGSTKMVIKGGVTLSLNIAPRPSVATPSPTTSAVTRPVSYAQVYLSYRALRQDLQRVNSAVPSDEVSVNGIPTITGLGKIDARNPLAVGVKLALNNGGNVRIYYWGVSSDDSTGYANARARMASRGDLYVFTLLTQDINIIGAYKAAFVQQADPTYARDKGVLQRFRMVLGSLALPTALTLVQDTIVGVATAVSGTATGKYRTFSIDDASTGAGLGVTTVLPGDFITFGLAAAAGSDWENRRGTHRISHVNSSFVSSTTATNLELVPGSTRWDDTAAAAADDVEFVIKDALGNVKASNYSSVTIATGTGGTLGSITYTRKSVTPVGGPYTIRYTASGVANANASFSLSGFTIVMTLGSTITHTQLAAAVTADTTLSALFTAVVASGGSQAVIPASQDPAAPASVLPESGTCTAEIVANDTLFNDLVDASATFLSDGVIPGDTIEIPVDPNNYAPDAFTGRLLTYRVASVLSETRLRIANGVDDDVTAARELPHYYLRDFSNRLLDNAAPNAINYRVRRMLTDDETITAAIALAQSLRSARATIVMPDRCRVSDLRDGSLTRTTPSVRTAAGMLPAYYLACCVAGVIAGTPSQMGLTNGTFLGIDRLENATDRFDEEQLSLLSDGGFFVCTVATEGALPECLHQLTTDPTTLETGEVSVVKNLDFISTGYQTLLKSFLGKYNAIPEALSDIQEAVDNYAAQLKGRYVANIGAPLLSGRMTSLTYSPTSPDTAEAFFEVGIPRPLNNIGFHLVVKR